MTPGGSSPQRRPAARPAPRAASPGSPPSRKHHGESEHSNAEDRTRELSREITTQRRLVSDLTGQLREPDGTWIEHDRNRLRHENQTLLFERNQLVTERAELQRRLDGARANVSRLNEQRVTQLFPNGPGPSKRSDPLRWPPSAESGSGLRVPEMAALGEGATSAPTRSFRL